MNTFYSNEELRELGIKLYGENVYIGRNAIIYNPEQVEIGHDVRIDDFSILSGKIVLGNYVHISHYCGLYGGNEGIFMSDYSGLSSKCSVYANSDDYSGDSMTNPMVPRKYKMSLIEDKVVFEKHAIIGTGCVVLPGAVLKEGSAMGAMSLCTHSGLDEWTLYAGIPAKKVRSRNKKILQLEEQFVHARENSENEICK